MKRSGAGRHRRNVPAGTCPSPGWLAEIPGYVPRRRFGRGKGLARHPRDEDNGREALRPDGRRHFSDPCGTVNERITIQLRIEDDVVPPLFSVVHRILQVPPQEIARQTHVGRTVSDLRNVVRQDEIRFVLVAARLAQNTLVAHVHVEHRTGDVAAPLGPYSHVSTLRVPSMRDPCSLARPPLFSAIHWLHPTKQSV